MNIALSNFARKRDHRIDQITKLAIFAVGGQGGGVLNGWIIELAEASGYDVQATSVAGVAQRTGATIYYLEMLQKSDAKPVFSLSPAEGDVDIVLAAELMEAGRAAMRGFITPDRTKLIVSTHRQFATVEKVIPGNGVSDSEEVMRILRDHAESITGFDMQHIAERAGTVISSSMFGALAGSGVLPFPVEAFREVVTRSGRGAEKSLAAFDLAYDVARADSDIVSPPESPADKESDPKPNGPERLVRSWADLACKLETIPEPARTMAAAGLQKVVAYQDLEYGREYLARLQQLHSLDVSCGGSTQSFAFTASAAKYLANAFAYDDIIRVADAKTQMGRFGRIKREVSARETNLLRVTEYTHPGAPEVVSLMPAGIGRRIEASPRAMRWIDRAVNRGRHIRTDRIGGFLSLYIIAGMRSWRRRLLRHQQEVAHIDTWLDYASRALENDYDLGVAILRVRRLIKGYSDTHARGLSKFDRVIEGAKLVAGRPDAAQWVQRLIDAALKDEKGTTLDGALATIRSFQD